VAIAVIAAVLFAVSVTLQQGAARNAALRFGPVGARSRGSAPMGAGCSAS
jgi:hypothetical protein